jgi:hypothetical protein
LTSGIDCPNEIAVGLAATHLVVSVGRGDYACHLPKRPIRFAAIHVIASHSDARLRDGRVPLQDNGVRLLIGCDPEEHHPDDSGKHDREDRNG